MINFGGSLYVVLFLSGALFVLVLDLLWGMVKERYRDHRIAKEKAEADNQRTQELCCEYRAEIRKLRLELAEVNR